MCHCFAVFVDEFPAFFKAFKEKCAYAIDDIGTSVMKECKGRGVGMDIDVSNFVDIWSVRCLCFRGIV